MGKAIIDVFNDAQAAIMAEICDYAYVNPSESPAKDLRYLNDYIEGVMDI